MIREELEEAQIERRLEVLLSHKDVTPAARKKLRGLIRYYRKFPHPFTKCVRDNRKRFGPRTEEVCSVIKDFVAGGTHKWRKGSKLSEDQPPEIDDEVLEVIKQVKDDPELGKYLTGLYS